MNKITFLLLFICIKSFSQNLEHIERQGEISFFSYTSVENIKAKNTKTLSIFNAKTKQIAVQILMRAFIFEKSLMQEHFNESYIESDLYPKAIFEGTIQDFNSTQSSQTRMITGNFTLKNISKPLKIKAKIIKTNNSFNIEGAFDVLIKDFNINVPKLLLPNISKKIEVIFNFKYAPYEK